MTTTEKHLVTIEFRYTTKFINEYKETENKSKNKTITIGLFDTLEEAIIEGNKSLEVLESHFPLHTYPSGDKAKKNRFCKNYIFGQPNKLVTNLAYLKTPFEFFAKIQTLYYANTNDAILSVLSELKTK